MATCGVDLNDVMLDRAAELVEKHGTASVCDHGCGSGELLSRLGERFPGRLELVGVDRFGTMCETHRPDAIPGVRLVDRDEAEYEQLVSGSGFDLVLSCFALHHYRLPMTELKALHCMLRPGGHLFMADWLFGGDEPGDVSTDVLSLLGEVQGALSGRHHRHHYTLPEAVDLVEASGFRDLDAVEARLQQTEKERRAYTEKRLARLRDSLKEPDERVPDAARPFLRAQTEAVISTIEEHSLDWSRYFVLLARR